MTAIIIQTTCGCKKEAKKIAKLLVKEKLAACVQFQKIKSVYEWKNELCVDKEVLLSIKTKKENFEIIQRKIKDNHSYDLPEIVAVEISKASNEYLQFIEGNTK